MDVTSDALDPKGITMTRDMNIMYEESLKS